MLVMVIDIAFGVLMASAGVVIGWWIHDRNTRRRFRNADADTRFAREVLLRIRDLAANVAADVGRHSSRVEEINEELASGGAPEAQAVVQAIGSLVEANERMQRQLVSADEKLQEQARQIESHAAEARTDALTNLPNRRAYDDEMLRRLAGSRRHGSTFSVFMMDVDHFKSLNDTHGHQAGDEVLRGLGKVLQNTARDADMVARYGGEEFAAVLPDTTVDNATVGAERFRQAIEDYCFQFGSKQMPVTVSVGVAELLDGEDGAAVIKRADAALYAAKQAGRNCVYWHDGEKIHPATVREKPLAEPAESKPAGFTESKPSTSRKPETRGDTPPAPAQNAAQPLPPTQPSSPAASPPKRAANAAVANSAGSDPLQSPRQAVCSRSELTTWLNRRLAGVAHGEAASLVVMVRIDDFSKTVSEYGQQTGTRMLNAAAQLLRAAFRDLELLAYYDVATLAAAVSDCDRAATVGNAERFRLAVERCSLPLADGHHRFTVSVSIAQADGNDALGLLYQAEEALDAALRAGGNCTYFHNSQWSETAESMLERTG